MDTPYNLGSSPPPLETFARIIYKSRLGRTPAKVAWRAGHANICRLLERWTAPSAPAAPAQIQDDDLLAPLRTGIYCLHDIDIFELSETELIL